jgi:hypothetical protein
MKTTKTFKNSEIAIQKSITKLAISLEIVPIIFTYYRQKHKPKPLFHLPTERALPLHPQPKPEPLRRQLASTSKAENYRAIGKISSTALNNSDYHKIRLPTLYQTPTFATY